MVYVSVEDFFQKTAGLPTLTREEARALAMRPGDAAARSRLIAGYLPMVANHIRRCEKNLQTLALVYDCLQALALVYDCLQALEQAVDSFDFLQNSETFAHRLSWHLRQATVRSILRQREG